MENILNYLADKYSYCVKYWWMLLVLGITLLLFGILMFGAPGINYLTMSCLLGLIILISGIIYIMMSSTRPLRGKGWLLTFGIIELVLGIILTIWPVIAAAAMPYFLSFWLLFKGIAMIGIGSDLSDVRKSAWTRTIISTIPLILCAFLTLVQPIIFGVEAALIWINISLFIGGITLINFSIQLKKTIEYL